MQENIQNRLTNLISYLQIHNFASVSELAAEFQVSESTIKRDLNALMKQQPIQRTHGGVYLCNDVLEPYSLRSSKAMKAKHNIAIKANEFISDEDTIFLEAGTTCFTLYQQITANHLTILTNSLSIATTYSEHADHIYSLGGEIDTAHLALRGILCVENLKQFQPQKYFLACPGLSANYEILNKHEISHLFHQEILKMPGTKILLMDSTKICTPGNGMFRSVSIQNMDAIITDNGISAEAERHIRNMGVELIIV